MYVMCVALPLSVARAGGRPTVTGRRRSALNVVSVGDGDARPAASRMRRGKAWEGLRRPQ